MMVTFFYQIHKQKVKNKTLDANSRLYYIYILLFIYNTKIMLTSEISVFNLYIVGKRSFIL